jgi:hypothetical protein
VSIPEAVIVSAGKHSFPKHELELGDDLSGSCHFFAHSLQIAKGVIARTCLPWQASLEA